MMKRRLADESSEKRALMDKNKRNGNNGTVNRNNTTRVNSGKAVSTCIDSNQNFTRTAFSENPHDSLNQMKKSVKQNFQSKDKQIEVLQAQKERLISARINRDLFRNMKESILSLSMLTNGLTKQVAQVRDQQKQAKKLWNDLENQLLRCGSAVKDDRRDFSNRNGSKQVRADTPATLMFPCIDTVVKSESSRPNSLPSLFRDIDSPDQRESDVFNESKTNQIKKIARKRTKEKSTKAEDMFPMVTQDLGLPRLNFKSKRINSASKQQPGLYGEKAARQRIEKRLIALEAFQDKYIVEAGKNQSMTNMDKNGSQDKIDTTPKQRQKKDGVNKMK